MASAIESTPPFAASAPGAGDATPVAWQLAALTRPARLGMGTPLASAARLWLDWVLQMTAKVLERTLDRPVTIDLPASDESPGASIAGPVFAVAFSHPACDAEGLIVLDAALGRVIVDALETDFANLRGNGSMTEAEFGLLEYTALTCVDQVLRDSAGPDPRGFTIRAFLKPSEIHERLRNDVRVPGILRVRIAGREGLLAIHLPGWETSDLAEAAKLSPPSASTDLSTQLTLRLALPPVALPAGELARLQPGDLLLLGATELQNLTDCRLVTSTGWTVAPAMIVRHSATLISLQCGAFDPQVWGSAAAPTGDQVVVTPTLGRKSVRAEQLLRWRSGMTLDLPKDSAACVELFAGGEPVAEAELVRLEGEIGLRVLDRGAPRPTVKRR